MNSLLFDLSEAQAGNILELSDHRSEHIRCVLKLKVGDELRVGQIDGKLGTAEVLEMAGSKTTLIFELQDEPPAPLPLRVLLALPRPKVLGRKLKSLAELGVKDIHLINAKKVESSYWTAHQLREDQVRKHLLNGLSQSNDTVLPRLHFEKGFRSFVEDKLPELCAETENWVAHPYTSNSISRASDKNTVLAIGPEGGWIDYELECFRRLGFQLGSLGPRVLSTETAIVSLVTRLS